MFSFIHIEKELVDLPRVKNICQSFPKVPINVIDRYDHTWGKFKKPYLEKRNDLHLYLAQKRGKLVKMAPDAYGTKGSPHFYFIHAYNCIYECQYCYLQGYFQTPDLVLFMNHEDILKEIDETRLSIEESHQEIWFHAGEFSDSLALSHLTKELPLYFSFFQKHPKLKLELRTKSVNIKELLLLSPLDNVYVSFSLSPSMMSKQVDLKTPSLSSRLKALQNLIQVGYKVAIHLDPIIYTPHFEKEYQELITLLVENNIIQHCSYISLGVVRFTSDVFKEVSRNYPDSIILAQELRTEKKLVRYPEKLRRIILKEVESLLLKAGVPSGKIYLCMED